MIKTLAVLVIALLASLFTNLQQYRGAAEARLRCDAEKESAIVKGRAQASQLAISRHAGMALLRAEDDLEIYRLRQWALDRPAQLVTVYRDRVQTVEVPVCRVSEHQVAAVNEVLQ